MASFRHYLLESSGSPLEAMFLGLLAKEQPVAHLPILADAIDDYLNGDYPAVQVFLREPTPAHYQAAAVELNNHGFTLANYTDVTKGPATLRLSGQQILMLSKGVWQSLPKQFALAPFVPGLALLLQHAEHKGPSQDQAFYKSNYLHQNALQLQDIYRRLRTKNPHNIV